MGKLEGSVAIVTGAARGNGEGAARVMAREGAIVILTDVLDSVKEITRSISDGGNTAISFEMDVTQADQVNEVVRKVLGNYGKVDILVNNAGICRLTRLIDMTEEIWNLHFNVNIKGMFLCAKAVLQGMIERRYGKIVNISSVTGPIVADPGEVAYAATKGAVWGFTKALAIEVAPYEINVNAVCPGYIETPMVWGTARETNPVDPASVVRGIANTIPLGRMGTTEEIGELVTFLASNESKYITGTTIVIDGGSTLPETTIVSPSV